MNIKTNRPGIDILFTHELFFDTIIFLPADTDKSQIVSNDKFTIYSIEDGVQDGEKVVKVYCKYHLYGFQVVDGGFFDISEFKFISQGQLDSWGATIVPATKNNIRIIN